MGDLRYIESVGRTVAQYANRPKIIIEKSTVPVKTAEALERVVTANQGASQKFWILSNPEFLAEGTAMKDLSAPDRVLIGGPTSTDGIAAASVLVDIYANWVPRDRILTTNLWSFLAKRGTHAVGHDLQRYFFCWYDDILTSFGKK